MNTVKKIKVAVIEDEEIVSKIISEELEETEFEVLKAFDGASGISIVKSGRPDIILLDIMMPKMVGFDSLKILKNDPDMRNIPVIILTVLSDDDSMQKARELGAADYIIKSKQRVAEIPDKIKRILSGKGEKTNF